MVDTEQTLAGRKSDLARQQEKTPDIPSSWQAIQRRVTSAERDLNKTSKEYQQYSERLHSVLTKLSHPISDSVSNIVYDALPSHGTDGASPNTPTGDCTGLKPVQNFEQRTNIQSVELRLAELEKLYQSTAANTESERQAPQTAMKAVTAEREGLRKTDETVARMEKLVDDLLKDHQNLVTEHHHLSERCTTLETENRRLSSKHTEFERFLEMSQKTCEELDKKTEQLRLDNRTLQEDLVQSRLELDNVKKEQSVSDEHHKKGSSALRDSLRILSENLDTVVSRVLNVEKQATTIESSQATAEKHAMAIESSLAKASEDLKGLRGTVESGYCNTGPLPQTMRAEVEDLCHIVTKATAASLSEFESVAGLVYKHQSLLNEFEPGELDKLWWALPEVKQETDRLKERFAALEEHLGALETGIHTKQTTPNKALRDTTSPPSKVPVPYPVTENSQHISDRLDRTARIAKEAYEHSRVLRKAQDDIIRGAGRMIDQVRSSVTSKQQSTETEIIGIKERLGDLEKRGCEDSQNVTDISTANIQAAEISEKISRFDKDLGETRKNVQDLIAQYSKLNNLVNETLSGFSDRLTGLQQYYLDLQRQGTSASSPVNAALPNPRPPARPTMGRAMSDTHEVKRQSNGEMNGSGKRRRMESPRHSGTPPTTNGEGRS